MNSRWPAARRLTRYYFEWWVRELGSCAQDLIAFIAPKWRRPLIVYVDTGRWLIMEDDRAGGPPTAEIPHDQPKSALPTGLVGPLANGLEQGRRVHVTVSEQRAFIQGLRLPIAALPHLKSAIALQMPKLLPMETRRLLTDFRIVKADAQRRVIDIEVAALKRADIDLTLNAVKAWGLRVSSIQLAAGIDGERRFRFEAPEVTGTLIAMGRLDRILVGTAAVLGLSCAALAAVQSYRAERAITQAQTEIRTAAGFALGRRQLLLTRLEPLKELSKLSRPPTAAAILADVTTLMPQDSWLTTFDWKQGGLRLIGISPDPAALVRRLSSSKTVANVELRSSTSAGVGTGKDRFEITADAIGPLR